MQTEVASCLIDTRYFIKDNILQFCIKQNAVMKFEFNSKDYRR